MSHRRLFAWSWLLVFATPAASQDKIAAAAPPPVTWDTIGERMQWEADRGFAGVVLVARDGQVVFQKAYGLANREKNIPMRVDTILAIGSTPIDFTKAGILLLAERGKLSLDDPITKYFDKVPADKKSITLRHLMTGRSGLQDFHDVPADRDPDHGWIDRAEAVKRILAQELLFEPGKGRQHSHSAWGLLAAVLEIASGQTYPEFTREHLFKPAGMSDTGFFGEKYAEDRMAIGYGPRKDGDINAPPYWGQTSWLVMGSGGQVSTAPDMWRWVQAVHGGKILKPESIKLYAPQGGQGILAGGDMYGFEIRGAGDHRNAVLILSNTGSPQRNPGLRRLAEDLAGLVTGRKPAKYLVGIQFAADDGKVTIRQVIPGGAAERDGLKSGDVVITIAGQSVGDNLLDVLAPFLESGEAIKFEVDREGKRETVTVKPVAR